MNKSPIDCIVRVVLTCLVLAGLPALTSADELLMPVQKDPATCGACHQRIYREWKSSSMAKTIDNPNVYQFYTGTNPKGEKDGIGYQGMHPGQAGDCADCHVPQLTLDEHTQGREVDLGRAMQDKLDYGISCHFCHTLDHVKLEKDAAGRYKTRLFETVTQDAQGHIQGPFEKTVAPHGATYNGLYKSSELCGACHLNQEKFLSISTYADWKQAYDTGVIKETCEDCHMPLLKGKQEVAVGAPMRDGLRAHTFIGARDPGLLEKALTLKVDAQAIAGILTVKTTVENVGAGHRVPGSGPIRNVILKVDVTDESGKPLEYTGDAHGLLSSLAGMGNSKTKTRDAQDWAGMPGKMYAKVYQSAIMPNGQKTVGVGGFAADSIFFDTTLAPKKPDQMNFMFKLPADYRGKIKISARLVYRWAFKPLIDSKGWILDDRPMTQVEKTLNTKGLD